jgi:hypothetical protein
LRITSNGWAVIRGETIKSCRIPDVYNRSEGFLGLDKRDEKWRLIKKYLN